MADNIGGIVSAEFCLIENVAKCGILQFGIILQFSTPNPWTLFPQNSLGKVNVSVKKSENDIYNVSGDIRCPAHLFQSHTQMMFPNNKKVLLRITKANGTIYIVGSKEFPVTIHAEILTPSTASDFNGVVYTLSGAQNHPQLIPL